MGEVNQLRKSANKRSIQLIVNVLFVYHLERYVRPGYDGISATMDTDDKICFLSRSNNPGLLDIVLFQIWRTLTFSSGNNICFEMFMEVVTSQPNISLETMFKHWKLR